MLLSAAANARHGLAELQVAAESRGYAPGPPAGAAPPAPLAPGIQERVLPPPPKPWREMTAAEVERHYASIGWGRGFVGGFVGEETMTRG